MNELTLTLIDTNSQMVNAWRKVFEAEHGVTVVQGSILQVRADAWVTPTNARAIMSGGVDAAIKGHLGAGIQARVRRAVSNTWGDAMPLGVATCVHTGRVLPSHLISTPTMTAASEDISATLNVALACAAAFQAARVQNRVAPGSIRSLAVPGLGAGTGRVAPDVCAELMWTAWRLFEAHTFESFVDVRAALEEELGELAPPAPTAPMPAPHRAHEHGYIGPRGPVLPAPYHGPYRAIA